jgi:acetyl-CoA carboxylase carboxyl transferase subunit alpha
VISIILGEGGSGGALALAVCDELAMLENAVYSVISPRGFASILWKDASREKEAAGIMKMTAGNLVQLKVADHIIAEPAGGAHTNPSEQGAFIADYLEKALERLSNISCEKMLETRYQKFRRMGIFEE